MSTLLSCAVVLCTTWFLAFSNKRIYVQNTNKPANNTHTSSRMQTLLRLSKKIISLTVFARNYPCLSMSVDLQGLKVSKISRTRKNLDLSVFKLNFVLPHFCVL